MVVLTCLFWHGKDFAFVSMDATPAWAKSMHSAALGSQLDVWAPDTWLGTRYGSISPEPNWLIFRFTDFPTSITSLFAFNLLLGGIGMYLLLRTLGLGTWPRYFGAFAYLLTNGVVTLIYPGHVNKVMTFAWVPFSLAVFLAGMDRRSLILFSFSGGFLGLSLLAGEVQVPYYLGFWYGIWICISCITQKKTAESLNNRVLFHTAALTVVGVSALLVGGSTVIHSLRYLAGNAPIAGGASSSQNWQFATQFYFPPQEVLSFITTIQFFGGPQAYWGHCGDPTPIRLSDEYMGLLPFALAILGGWICWKKSRNGRFFVIMGLGSLLASFGRSGLVYGILYQLPLMKSQRNPHRWSYFVAIAACVLAAHGLQWLIEKLSKPVSKNEKAGSPWRKWSYGLWIFTGVGAVLYLTASGLQPGPESVAKWYYGDAAMTSNGAALFLERTRMMLEALIRTGLFLVLSSLTLWLALVIHLNERLAPYRRIAWIPMILTLVLDLSGNAKRYLYTYDWKARYLHNDLANFFKQDPDLFRIKVLGTQQSPILNDLVTNILPFHRLQVVDPPASSRLPTDYGALFDHLQNHYTRTDRYFDFFNVKYILAPGPFADANIQLQSIGEWNGLHLYKREHFLPRAWLVSHALVVKDGPEEILTETFHPSRNFRDLVVLESSPQQTSLMAPSDGKIPTPPEGVGNANITRYEDNFVELVASTDRPAMLVVGEKWDADWKAWLDGKAVPILKANFLMRAIELSPGTHSVVMKYRPSNIGFWISLCSLAAMAAGGFIWWTGIGKSRGRSCARG